jgi:hypothetical protein
MCGEAQTQRANNLLVVLPFGQKKKKKKKGPRTQNTDATQDTNPPDEQWLLVSYGKKGLDRSAKWVFLGKSCPNQASKLIS